MRPINFFGMFIVTSVVVSCAPTPPGQLTAEDFVSKEISLPTKSSATLQNFINGARYCGPEIGGFINVTLAGEPVCYQPQGNGAVLCDVYSASASYGRSTLVLGKVEIEPNGDQSRAKMSIQKWIANKDKTFNAWTLFLNGTPQKACP